MILPLLLLFGCAPSARPTMRLLPDYRDVPILMYHAILKDPARAGKYVVSPDALESDLRWLLDNGYETVVTADLIAFVAGTGTLPDKPVMLTFDDGYRNNMTYVLPLLEQYGCRAVISPVGAYTERYTVHPDPNPNYAYLSWVELAYLQKSGCFELQNHSYDMHGSARCGSMRRAGETEADYRAAFTADATKMQQALSERTGVIPTAYVYPFGAIDPLSRQMLAELGFAASFSCQERVSRIMRGDESSLFSLGRFNRADGRSAKTLFEQSAVP